MNLPVGKALRRYALVFGLFFFVIPASAVPNFKKVLVIVFENADYADVLQRPFFARLARQGALLSNFHGEAHPSQPNYLAMISGDVQGCTGDDNTDLPARHLGDLLEAKKRTWKVYAEGYPGNCYLEARKGTYVRKHNPFISFQNIQNDPKRCRHIVSANEFQKDLEKDALPDFAYYVPDLNDDGHDTGSEYADRWFSLTFSKLLSDRRFTKDRLLVVTFDESLDDGPLNHIYTVLWGDSVVAGAKNATKYNHYSILRTIEDAWHLGTLSRNDQKASAIANVWK